jgi:hypothetical protein
MRAICVVFLLFALSPSAIAQDQSGKVLITLERTSCLGACPIYKLTLHGDGSVLYEGHKFVRVAGRQESKIERAAVQSLVQTFMDIGYFDLQDDYLTIKHADGAETFVTDLPMTITSLTLGQRSKKVRDYIGAPKKLKSLEHQIDAVAGSKRWVSIDAPSVHEESRRGWDVRSQEGQRLFLDAVASGDAEVVKAFIDEGADVNSPINAILPLQLARGVKVVKLLVSAGANVNGMSKKVLGPPLENAAKLGDVDSIQALIEAGAKVNGKSADGTTVLMEAAKSGNPDAVMVLLAAGADAHAKNDHGDDALEYVRLGRQNSVWTERNDDPFSVPIPDYWNKFKKIEDLLLSAIAAAGQPSSQ